MEHIDCFKIIGLGTVTTNENGKAAEDIGKLWKQFYSKNVSDKITVKESDDVYSIYTDYESDYSGKYTCLIGLKVNSLDNIPEGLTGREFKGGKYQKFVAKGPMPNAVLETWREIWKRDKKLNRKYTADFEIYGPNSQNGEKSEVDIYIATK